MCGTCCGCGCNKDIADVLTGELRRKAFPLEEPATPGAEAALQAPDLAIERKLHALKDGAQLFYQVVVAKDKEPSHVLVATHGYGKDSDFLLEHFSEYARSGAQVVLLDLPSFGRSDGMLGLIEDWFQWVDKVWEFMDSVVDPLRKARPGMKLFFAGHSLGGGVAMCMDLLRPAFFDGLILLAPMLSVSEEVLPAPAVQWIVKNIIGPMKISWPLAPSEPLEPVEYRIPSQGEVIKEFNEMGMHSLKPRLVTSAQLAFTFPEWVADKFKELSTPFLILHGEFDKITDPASSKRLHEEAQASDKEIKVYEGAFHNELVYCTPGIGKLLPDGFLPEQYAQTEQVVRDVSAWMAARIAATDQA